MKGKRFKIEDNRWKRRRQKMRNRRREQVKSRQASFTQLLRLNLLDFPCSFFQNSPNATRTFWTEICALHPTLSIGNSSRAHHTWKRNLSTFSLNLNGYLVAHWWLSCEIFLFLYYKVNCTSTNYFIMKKKNEDKQWCKDWINDPIMTSNENDNENEAMRMRMQSIGNEAHGVKEWEWQAMRVKFQRGVSQFIVWDHNKSNENDNEKQWEWEVMRMTSNESKVCSSCRWRS